MKPILRASSSCLVCALFLGCQSNVSELQIRPDLFREETALLEPRDPSALVSVYALIDLPRTTATQGISGTAFDPTTRTLFALQDHSPNIVALIADPEYRSFRIGPSIKLTGRTDQTWDGEGLVRTGDGFIVIAEETTAKVEHFDHSGKFLETVPRFAKFENQALPNFGLESLTLSPSGRYLFTANESALRTDGWVATKTHGTTVRLLRRELASASDQEVAYRTEPLGAGSFIGVMGVSELVAFSDNDLLVLERGYQPLFGNTVRIFRVNFASGRSVEAIGSLSDTTPVLAKKLVVDLATLPSAGVPNPSPQPNPVLDNYEALAIGPIIADGRRLLFVTSDDNGSASQVPRVIVLAVPGL